MDWLHVKEFHGIFSTKRFPQRIDKRSSSRKNALRSREQQNVQQQFSSCSRRVGIFAEHAHKKQQGAYNNCAIGNVKRRPVVNADIEIQKVSHLAIRKAVPEIAHSATQNQRKSQSTGMEDTAVFP